MGQYYLPIIIREEKTKKFKNYVDGERQSLKLMEHSYWRNQFVGNVVNDLFYNKGRVCWVGDYYDEDDYSQVNCEDRELVKIIGSKVWKSKSRGCECKKSKSRLLNYYLLVNHTKKTYIDCNEYYEKNKWQEEYQGEKFWWCVHPLPLLTCTASHSGGSYYGPEKEKCGTWFYDIIEVVENWDEDDLIRNGYKKVEYSFKEN